MRPRVAAFGTLGALATALAAVVVFQPDTLARLGPLLDVADALDAAEPRYLLFAASVAVGLFLTGLGWSATGTVREDRDEFDEATAEGPESVTSARQRLTGAGLDAAFDDAVGGDDAAAERVRDRLRTAAVRAYARSEGCERDEARRAVRAGNWTDDRTAGAVLADRDGPTHSLGARLRLWLDPERERERRYRRVVEATARLGGGDR